jgi:GAF domain-containing protein
LIDKATLFPSLIEEIRRMADVKPASVLLTHICQLLRDNIPNYDWVGFYMVNPDNDKELLLGPYSGAPTEHVRIPFGKGICGQAAETKKTLIIDDVSKEKNYLACSLSVKSEIVVPIIRNGKIIGELDLDSHAAAAFDERDRRFLEEICVIVSNVIWN